MKRVLLAGAACVLAALTAGCVESPAKPIPDAARRSVTAVTADISGVKSSDTSRIGARGSEEGGKIGAAVGANMAARSAYNVIGLLLIPVSAAIGGVKGAAEAQSVEVVDATRGNLRLALQETDFAELLRQRLAASRSAGKIEVVAVTAATGTVPTATASGTPVSQMLAVEYDLHPYAEDYVNPKIGVRAVVNVQVQSPDRRQLIHRASWVFCGERRDFVQMGADNAAIFRAQIDEAAAVLAQAIPYDLYVSNQPRALKGMAYCMDFSDIVSRAGIVPAVARATAPQPTPAAPMPVAATPAVAKPVAPPPSAAPAPPATPVAAPPPQATATKVASTAPATDYDGTWTVEMQLTLNYGGPVGGDCPGRFSTAVTFVNGTAEGPWGKVGLAADGEASGWLKVTSPMIGAMQVIATLSGRVRDATITGTVSGRCAGTFVMRKQ